jgi:hypothetical protein
MGGNAAADFSVALHAFKGCLAAKLVTARAVGGSAQGLMWPRQRAGRDLRLTDIRYQEKYDKQKAGRDSEIPCRAKCTTLPDADTTGK